MIKDNTAWLKLFDKYNILQSVDKKGIFEISASQIKEFREPKLVTKFDHRSNLPEIFNHYDLSILPITR